MKFLCIILSVFCLFGLCFGQKKKPAKRQPKKIPVSADTSELKIPEYLKYYPFYSKPFDGMNWEKVPVSFRGNSMKQIYQAIAKKFYDGKDEFETTQNYLNRLEADQKQPLLDEILFNSLLSVIGKSYTGEYDADTQTLSILPEIHNIYVDFGNYTVSKSIDAKVDYKPRQCVYSSFEQSLEQSSTYAAQNAYGMTTTVKQSMYKFYGLAFSNYQKLSKNSSDKQLVFKIKINPEKAREAKKDLQVLYLFRMIAPYKGWVDDRISPTLQNPKDEIKYSLCNYGEVSEIWFYNQQTGYIYHKEKID